MGNYIILPIYYSHSLQKGKYLITDVVGPVVAAAESLKMGLQTQ